MVGYNCLSERSCIPQDYVCDGVPDCFYFTFALDELTDQCNGKQCVCLMSDIFPSLNQPV